MPFPLPPCWRSIGLSLLLAGTSHMHAQAQGHTPPAPIPTPGPASDVILRLDGQEVAGRVVLITPVTLYYLPAAGAAPRADTLRMAVARVFLVRYANGTRDVLTRPTAAAPVSIGEGQLDTLSAAGRQRLGRRDATRCYHGRNVFWGSAGAAFYVGPLLGLVSTGVIAHETPYESNLRAPVPALLQDPDYGQGYRQQAHRIKRSKAWAGYGVGTGALIGVLYIAVAASLAQL